MKTKLVLLLNFVLIFSALPVFGQFNQNSSKSLFSDFKAYRKGDAVTVLIVEDLKAENSATTSDSRNTDMNAGFGFSTGETNTDISGGLETGTSFSGKGKTSREEQIRTKLSTRVTNVDENGNLEIEGKRTTTINGETQTITIKGFVRPVDIRTDNSVYSHNILELTLTIEGEGSVSSTQEPGLITKFLRFLF